jgi:hypothetical protein
MTPSSDENREMEAVNMMVDGISRARGFVARQDIRDRPTAASKKCA